jgi:hypothetical protein
MRKLPLKPKLLLKPRLLLMRKLPLKPRLLPKPRLLLNPRLLLRLTLPQKHRRHLPRLHRPRWSKAKELARSNHLTSPPPPPITLHQYTVHPVVIFNLEERQP